MRDLPVHDGYLPAPLSRAVKDDVAFAKFINYDDYAREWMLARASTLVDENTFEHGVGRTSQHSKILGGVIPQVTIPVLPNTGS
jgi:hypothetical protein